jgi:DNA-binding IclR family transcriptional regulator
MRDGTDVVRHGEPVLRILSRQTSETAYLAIPHQDRVLCLDKILGGGPDAVRGPRIGSRVNPQVSAAGKLFLAQGAISHSRIGGRPSNPPVAPPACDVWGLGRAGDLHNIRESGATDGGESQLGITSVVAGVHNSDSRTVAAVCLVLPDSRYQRVRAPIDQAVRVAATHLSLRLGSQVSPAPMTIVHDNQDAYHGGHTREHPMHPASSA